ncbi:hypothetical protein FPHYL_4771 [Fusarium phyllophilum]|uniref:Uncharacterized protein n=1 Tax=Fusarium phyllophilum TaxID=47803 RepID=A0A8H5K100_9HYPO|nr:hypothetical protein FPHYL_4771 [Fusarium phyllophilum]
MITTLQKPLSQSHAVLRTGASVFSTLSRFHIANPLARFPQRLWRPPIFRLQHQTRGLRTLYRPPRATPTLRDLSTDEKLDKLMASAARFEQEYKATESIKQRLAAIDKANPAIAKYRESLAQTAEREDLESFARKISEKHEHELSEAWVDGAASVVFTMSMLLIISLIVAALPSVSEDEKESAKPESQSLEEKDTPPASSTKTYRRKTNKAETEIPEIKCTCHHPLELDNTRVL